MIERVFCARQETKSGEDGVRLDRKKQFVKMVGKFTAAHRENDITPSFSDAGLGNKEKTFESHGVLSSGGQKTKSRHLKETVRQVRFHFGGEVHA